MTGELNGILFENAVNEIIDIAFDPVNYPTIVDIAYIDMYTALKDLAQFGITSAVDARAFWKTNMHLPWQMTFNNGFLTAKILMR